MKTKVVNKYTEAFDQYIGRGTIFGNPFIIGRDGNRDQVCDKYEEYFYKRIKKDPIFKKSVEDLKGKRLGCFCKPKRCHGDTIVKYLEEIVINDGPKFTIIDSIKTYLCVAGEYFLSNNIDWEIIVNEEGDKILKGTKK